MQCQGSSSELVREGRSRQQLGRYGASEFQLTRGTEPLPLSGDCLLILSKASKVAILGGAGGIGQPLSLLMKLNPRVTELAIYDVKGAPGQLDSVQERA